jgi:hypothetical protein
MTSISAIIRQKREQACKDTPQKPKDYITQKIEDHLGKLDSNVESVLSKSPLSIDTSRSGKSTRYELKGKPIEIETEEGVDRIPISLIVYEDNEGIKEACYTAQDSKRNRVIMRQIVINHEVQMA